MEGGEASPRCLLLHLKSDSGQKILNYSIGDSVQYFFQGNWYCAVVEKLVYAGIRVVFDCDNSSLVIPHQHIESHLRKSESSVLRNKAPTLKLSEDPANKTPDDLSVKTLIRIGSSVQCEFNDVWYDVIVENIVPAGIRVRFKCDNGCTFVPLEMAHYRIRECLDLNNSLNSEAEVSNSGPRKRKQPERFGSKTEQTAHKDQYNDYVLQSDNNSQTSQKLQIQNIVKLNDQRRSKKSSKVDHSPSSPSPSPSSSSSSSSS